MFSRFNARPAIDFGDSLARRFAELYPPALDKPGAPGLSANRLAHIMESLCRQAQAFQRAHGLGYYRRARLAHAFKWRLLEYGYTKPLIDAATEALVVYLLKPAEGAPELEKARAKRERKASRAKEQTSSSSATTEPEPVVDAPATVRYSRAQPSQRYLELTRLYRQMHEQGETSLGIPPEQTFPGLSLLPQAARIKRLIDESASRRILDYGSGKGQQYQARNIVLPDVPGQWPSIQAYWGVDEITCYDPAYPAYSDLPRGAFDGVISTDVLEHCPEEDLPWIVDEIFSYARKFVYANVACYPAKKRLPTGENAHCTIRPYEWWAELVQHTAQKHPNLRYEFRVQWKDDTGRIVEKAIENKVAATNS